MSEDSEQKAIISWARWQPLFDLGMAGMIADYLHHSPTVGQEVGEKGRILNEWEQRQGFLICFYLSRTGAITAYLSSLKPQRVKPKTANISRRARCQSCNKR
ncbi:hypothetical protein LP097_09460 [Moraxella bovis]|nr:hypothetical protein [Moraxella bovis]UZA29174.1 hypothetical protein LP097_09460 [Moraxella bovis]